ncbi:MAG: hypothetical protein WA461_16105 [Nitrososphaeraceae archaeon]
MYVDLGSYDYEHDLAKSTNSLPLYELFSYEATSVIPSHRGYALKYVSDAVIAFFHSSSDRIIACKNSVKCARSISSVIKNGINPILNQYDYSEFCVK